MVQSEDCIWIHQNQYILSLLRKFGLMDANPASTPADQNVKLVKDDGVSKKLEDKVQWLAVSFTPPDQTSHKQ